jgi:hypothetical protein
VDSCAGPLVRIRKRQGPSCLANKALHRVNKHRPPTLHHNHHHPAVPISQSSNLRPRNRYVTVVAYSTTMSYNGRMSMARTTSHNQRAPPVNEHDAFMTLVRQRIPWDQRDTNRSSRTTKSQAAFQTSVSSSPSRIYRNRTLRSSKRSSNGWLNCS